MSEVEQSLLPSLERLRGRWRVVALTCGISVALTIAVTLLLPQKYTAVSQILIEPPAGSDPRSSTAVSPIYLESLRSYELFASSDSLFLQAVQKFGLRQGSEPIDKLKKSALKTEMPRNLKILEVQATLPDPKTAHALALYIAEEAVKLNRAVSREADQELIREAEGQAVAVRARMQSAQQAWARFSSESPVEQLKAELDADEELRATLQEELAESAVVADTQLVEGYRRQLDSLQRKIAGNRKLYAERSVRGEELSSERAAAQAALKSAEAHVQEARSSQGYRGERLRIIDPGIVPERPSSPNLPLNVLIALFAAVVLSLLYLALEVSYTGQRAESNRRSMRVAGRHD
jgi:uncharacterized protein involved in exopolysaccharide biosynthesis